MGASHSVPFPFGRLPQELQDEIWLSYYAMTAPDADRVVSVLMYEATRTAEPPYDGALCEIRPKSVLPTPTILHICGHSRDIGLRYYTQLSTSVDFGHNPRRVSRTKTDIFIHPSTDTVYLATAKGTEPFINLARGYHGPSLNEFEYFRPKLLRTSLTSLALDRYTWMTFGVSTVAPMLLASLPNLKKIIMCLEYEQLRLLSVRIQTAIGTQISSGTDTEWDNEDDLYNFMWSEQIAVNRIYRAGQRNTCDFEFQQEEHGGEGGAGAGDDEELAVAFVKRALEKQFAEVDHALAKKRLMGLEIKVYVKKVKESAA